MPGTPEGGKKIEKQTDKKVDVVENKLEGKSPKDLKSETLKQAEARLAAAEAKLRSIPLTLVDWDGNDIKESSNDPIKRGQLFDWDGKPIEEPKGISNPNYMPEWGDGDYIIDEEDSAEGKGAHKGRLPEA